MLPSKNKTPRRDIPSRYGIWVSELITDDLEILSQQRPQLPRILMCIREECGASFFELVDSISVEPQLTSPGGLNVP